MTKCQTDNVKSGTLDKNSQCHDTTKHPKTSDKKSCKCSACMATPVRQSRDTLIHSVSPADSQSAPEQSENEQEYDYPTKSDQDSSQDVSSDNLGAEPETPQSDYQKCRGMFNARRDSPNDSQE